jgi:nitrate reductase NapD
MNICGLLVHANPTKAAAVADRIAALAGAEVHQRATGGRLVVTVEDSDAATAFDTMTEIHRIDGVVAATLVYHNFEADAESAAANH